MLRRCEDYLGPNQQPGPGHDVARDHVGLQGGLSGGQCPGPAPDHSLNDLRDLNITHCKTNLFVHDGYEFSFVLKLFGS